MIELTTPSGRVLIDETRISAVSEENKHSQISCRVWVGETITGDSGFNIVETYEEVIKTLYDIMRKEKLNSLELTRL